MIKENFNFVKIFPYLVYETEDSALLVSNESKILATTTKETTYLNQVKLISPKAPSSTQVGQALYAQNSDEKEIIAQTPCKAFKALQGTFMPKLNMIPTNCDKSSKSSPTTL